MRGEERERLRRAKKGGSRWRWGGREEEEKRGSKKYEVV